MYLAYYQLRSKPFQISTDPEFLWLGEKHREALATLKYGILDNRGFLLLTGDVGTGKTTLINALLESLGNEVVVATVPDPSLDKLDFFNYVAAVFGIEPAVRSKGEFLILFRKFLHQTFTQNRKALLIIDEAQRMNQELLEEIRLLSNIERQDAKLLNIFFVGQNEFNESLLEKKNRALRQRITVNYNLDPLTLEETGDYIRHRIGVAGGTGEIFDAGAVREIFSFSEGYPRLINIICDHALLTGYVKGARKIGAAIIGECAQELRIPVKPTAGEAKVPAALAASAPLHPAPIFEHNRGKWSRYVFIILFASILLVFSVVFFHLGRLSGDFLPWPKLLKQTEEGYRIPESAPPAQPLPAPEQKPVPDAAGLTNERELATENLTASSRNPQAVEENIGAPPRATGPPPPTTTTPADSLPAAGEPGQNSVSIDQDFVVYFARNSNTIPSEGYATLDRLARIARQNPNLELVVKGYADNTGPRAYNQQISQFRAELVKGYIAGKGVNPQKITSMGMGPVEPDPADPDAGRYRSDRRVVVELRFPGS